MRRKLWRSLTVGALAVALSIAGTNAGADTAPPDVRPMAVDPYTIIAEIGIQLLSHAFSSGGVSEADLARAVAQITAEIEQTKAEIINHIDAVASAEVQACARSNTIEFASINSMSKTVLQLWAQSATACETKATAYLNALSSPQAVDNIGWLVGEIFTIVIAARTKAGLTEGLDLVRQDEISALGAVVSKLAPDCRTATWWPGGEPDPDADMYLEYTCTAYTGRQARFTELYQAGSLVTPPVDLAAMKDEAARGTSWSGAVGTLALLRAVVPPM